MLIVWGKNDVIFPAPGAHAYLHDLPEAELHLLDSGHFALEDKVEEIARSCATSSTESSRAGNPIFSQPCPTRHFEPRPPVLYQG